MVASPRRIVLVALLAALLLGSSVSARQASQAVPSVPVDPAECVVAPRPTVELRALAVAGFLGLTDRQEATPTPSVTPAPAPLPLRERPDAGTLAAVTVVLGGFIACSNGGNLPAMVALQTDEAAEPVLASGARSLQRVTTGEPDPEALDSAILDAYLASIAIPVPLPADARQAVLEVRDAYTLPDGRVAATVVATTPRTAPETFIRFARFRSVDGRWLLDVESPDPSRADATPAAAAIGTAAALPAPVDPSECGVERLSAAEMRTLLDAGLAARTAAAEQTAGAPAVASPVVATPPAGVPADSAVVAAITAAARESAACTNAGDLPAQLALMTEETAGPYLAAVALSLLGEGGSTPAPALVDPAARDRVIANLETPTPRGPSDQEALVAVRDARLLPDGRVRATVVWMTARTAPETFGGMADFCYEDGRYRWHVAAPRRCGAPGEPVAAPAAAMPVAVPMVGLRG